ncbi:CMP-sialic acid transporter-like isoform X1 [Planococcus citri]|uniref:CMP-sialic acid transporter-like isoform X1 n=2 Tax=Planococcus citri TaxID=170843 RepID=UPI0031F7D047
MVMLTYSHTLGKFDEKVFDVRVLRTLPVSVLEKPLKELKEEDSPRCNQTFLKYLCLISLVIQNAAYALLLKYSFMKKDTFITSTAVCLSEILKVVCSVLLLFIFGESRKKIGSLFYNSVMKTPMDTLNVVIPAVAYVVMNNLMYISNQNLDVITFQVIGQVKIPMTVIFSMIFLRSTYRRLQYLSLIILTIGVMIVVQFTEVDRSKSRDDLSANDKVLGYVTGIIAALLSGFAGVYFERILKTTTLSVWARNLQLSLISVPLAFLQTFTKDYSPVREKGFFHEYTNIVWLIVVLQTSSGLTVALSVKLADNVSKGYASATAIIVSGFVSVILFHYSVNYLFACGAALVVMSIPMYAISSSSSKILPEKIDYEGKECYI